MMLKAKLCGMKTVGAARAAEGAGADFIGFIFWRRSHRFVEPEQAARIVEAVPYVKKVGVFVDEQPEVVNLIARQCHLDFVQLHGHEDAAYAEQMEVPVIKAYRYGDGFSAEAANAYPAAMILVDAYQEGTAGLAAGSARSRCGPETRAHCGRHQRGKCRRGQRDFPSVCRRCLRQPGSQS